jgi:hypothetical protein
LNNRHVIHTHFPRMICYGGSIVPQIGEIGNVVLWGNANGHESNSNGHELIRTYPCEPEANSCPFVSSSDGAQNCFI